MSDPRHPQEGLPSRPLPPELEDLHRELARLRIRERPSFAPELEAELRAAWRGRCQVECKGKTLRKRALSVAVVGGLILATAAVPSAWGAVVRMVSSAFQSAAAVVRVAPPPSRTPISEEASRAVGAMRTDGFSSPRSPLPERLPPKGGVFHPARYTFPELADPQKARDIISSHYPEALQKAGVGGSVTLWFWLTPEGKPENIQVRRGSGYQSLDYAAMMALRKLGFRPATRNGAPVGTWVEFTVRFEVEGEEEEGPVLEAVHAGGTRGL